MAVQWQSLEQRAARSLERVGLEGIRVRDLGGGKVELVGTSKSTTDVSIAIAVVRSVPGVRSVTPRDV